MKLFKNILEAVQYQSICPVCHKRDFATNFSIMDDHILVLNQIGYSINIDLKNDAILNLHDNYKAIDHFVNNSPASFSCPTPRFPQYGSVYETLQINCRCLKFGYVARVKMYTNDNSAFVWEVGLNTEWIRYNSCRISNNYVLQFTSFREIKDDQYQPFIKLPLMPLDLNNPEETYQRIKKLLVFI